MGYSYGYGFGHTWKRKKRAGAVAPPAVGGAELLVGETDGFATDFLYAIDAQRVALKTSGSTVVYAINNFYQNAGTSPKMVYDVAGVLGWSPHNTCLQSQTFSIPWGGNALTITPNAITAPNGAMQGYAFVPPAGPASPYINQPPAAISGAVVTFSVYAKNGTLTPWFLIQSDTSAWFNLATGVKGTTSGSPISSNMIDAGNGWYRCDMTFTAASAAPQVYLAMAIGDGAGASCTTGDGVKVGFYLWGAQMNRGYVPTAYLPTTTAARVGLALDYDPVTHAAKGLLCEPAATNLLLASEAFGSWSPAGVTVTVNTTASPTGTVDADTLTFTSAAGDQIYSPASSTAAAYTFSLFAKVASGTRLFRLRIQSGVDVTSTDFTATTTWQRFSYTLTLTNTTAYCIICNSTAGAAGNLIVWGAQFELGSVATSYIPTTPAVTVTRAVDFYNVTPASIGYSATAGSWWADIEVKPSPSFGRIIGQFTGGYAPIYMASNTQFSLYDPNIISVTVGSVLGTHKVASAFASADRAVTADGLTPAIDTAAGTGLLSPGTWIDFGNGQGFPMNGYIRKLRYLPRRPGNAELVSMTGS